MKKDDANDFLSGLGIKKIIVIAVCVIAIIMLSLKDGSIAGLNTATHKKAENNTDTTSQGINEGVDNTDYKYVNDMEKELKAALENAAGVGRTEVMITLKASSEKVALKDNPYDTSNEHNSPGDGTLIEKNSSKRDETTVYEENGNDKIPYIIKKIEPQVNGVLVVAEGGDNPEVKKEIIETIQVLFGVELHKIKVMKLK